MIAIRCSVVQLAARDQICNGLLRDQPDGITVEGSHVTPDHGRIHAKLAAPASAAKATASSATRAHRARRAMRLAAKGRPVVTERAACYLAKWCCLLPISRYSVFL